jgi:hypothetical protein
MFARLRQLMRQLGIDMEHRTSFGHRLVGEIHFRAMPEALF